MSTLYMKNFTKRYPGFVLDPVTLVLEPGEILGVVGTNGAGKTTLLEGMFGATRPDAGVAMLFDQDVAVDSPELEEAKQRLAYVPSSWQMPAIPASDLALLGSRLYDTWSQATFDRICAESDIDSVDSASILSDGEAMQLSLAFALAHTPDFLVLDEPTAGLDIVRRRRLVETLRDHVAATNATIVVSSHVINDIEALADRVIALDAGQIVFDLPVEDIQDHGVATLSSEKFSELAVDGLFEGALVLAHPYSLEVLIANRRDFAAACPDVATSPVTLEKFLSFHLEGSPYTDRIAPLDPEGPDHEN